MKFPNNFRQRLTVHGVVILRPRRLPPKDLDATSPSIVRTPTIARFCKMLLVLLGAASLLPFYAHATVMRALQQQPFEQQQPSSAMQPHKIKVWTNDDIVTLRTPADIYILEKEAKAAAEDAKALMSCFAPGAADAEVEDTQKEIDAASQSIRDAEAAVTQARKDLEAAPESLKPRSRTELDRRTLELDAYRDQLKLLQQRLQKLNTQPASPKQLSAENPTPPSTEPPQ